MYKVAGELEFDVRSGVANARLAAREIGNLGTSAQRSSINIETLAKRIFGARNATDYLAKTLSRLGPSLIGGAVGGTALGAIVSSAKQAVEEMNKLADSLDKAVGARAGATIGDTVGKINSLTTAIEESADKISKQSPMASVAAFFMNEDADRAAKAFVNAVEERIKLGQKLVDQTAEQNAQTQISSTLEGKLGEVYKINIAYRKRLAEISDMRGVNETDKERLKILAEEARSIQTIIVLNKERLAEEKKRAEEAKKIEEDYLTRVLEGSKSLQQQEEELFRKNAEAFKKSQEEKIKAFEDANKRLIENSKKASNELERQDKEREESRKRRSEGAQFLLQGAAGSQALAAARRRRQIEVTRENFKLREATLSEMASKATAEEGITINKQDIRKRLAAQQVAQEMPSMRQRIIAEEAGISPELLASGQAAQTTSKAGVQSAFSNVLESLKKAVEDLSKKIPSAVPQ